MTRSKIKPQNQEVTAEVDFVSRWSKLKYDNRHNSEVIEGDKSVENKVALQDGVSDSEQQTDVKVLTDEDMPDIKSMTPDSDYTDFLSPGVSEELRNAALRKLFLSEVFNIRDGLNEYDEDYTHFESLGDIVTADMKHQLELKAERMAEQILQDEQGLNDDGSTVDELNHENRLKADSAEGDPVEVDLVEVDHGNEQDQFKNNNNKNAADKSTRKFDETAEHIDLQIYKTDKDTG